MLQSDRLRVLKSPKRNNRTTRKHLAAVDAAKRVLVLSKAREAKLHDKRFHDDEDIAGSVPDEIPIEVDLGFLGLQQEYDHLMLTAAGLWNFYLMVA